jgi:hypothetical protein
VEKSLKFIGLTRDMRYVFTNKGIISVFESVDENNHKSLIKYTPENIPQAVNMVKEVNLFEYSNKVIDRNQLLSSSRKFLNRLVEVVCDKNESLNIINEWENNFGDKLLLLNESDSDELITERVSESWDFVIGLTEAWYNPFSKDFVAYKPITWAYDKGKKVAKAYKEGGVKNVLKKTWDYGVKTVKNVYNTVKDAVVAAWKCLTGNFVECLMEGLRSLAMSVAGVGILTAVSFIPGVGQIPTLVIFGILLIWDIYKMLSGKYESGKYAWSWMDIIIDAISLLFPVIGKGIKALAIGGVKTISAVWRLASKTPILGKALTLISKSLSKIGGWIAKGVKFIGEKLGIKWLANYGSKAEASLSSLAKGGSSTATKTATKTVTGTGSKETLKQTLVGQGANYVMPSKGIIVATTGGAMLLTAAVCDYFGLDDWTCKQKAESGELTPEQIKKAKEETEGKISDELSKSKPEAGIDYPEEF